MTHKEKCDACREAYEKCNVDELKEVSIKALNISGKAKADYLNARDSYHKIYREIWNN